MRIRTLRFAAALTCGALALASVANAGTPDKLKKYPWADADHVIYAPAKGVKTPTTSLVKAGSSLVNHGGPTITSAKVVFLFWGPSFCSGGSDTGYASTLQAFRSQFGNTGEYNTITQYSGIQLANLGSGTADDFDCSTPPTNVTDSIVRSHVNGYLSTHTFNSSTIYEVVIPSSSYSSSGSSTSCGGPSLSYCAYHGHFASGSNDVKYSIEPWPGCSGCSVSGWSNVQNQEHFVCHETREAVTDPDLNAWYDRRGNEADDKCAWSPAPFFGTGGYGYQYEWSNSANACVKTQ
jgi:hypothetical protein